MQPDNLVPDQTPNNEPVNSPVMGGESQTPRVNPTSPESPKRRRGLIFAVIVVLIIIVAAVVAWLLLRPAGTTRQTSQQTHGGNNNPAHLAGIAVGNYPYVVGCKVFSPQVETNDFAAIAGDSLEDLTYAEDGLPVADIPANGIQSKCSRQFASGTPYDNATLVFNIMEFPTTAAAQKQYDAFSVSQSDLNKANQRFGTNQTTDFAPLSGVANTVYSPSQHISYTLERNTVFSFTADPAAAGVASFQQNLAKAVTDVRANIDSTQAGRLIPTDPSFGKTIGSSTLANPCTIFSGDIYKQATGNNPNPTQIELMYNYGADQYFPTDTSDGWATNSCERVSYPGTKSGPQNETVQIQYYKTTDEAASDVKQQVQRFGSDPFYDQTVEPVSGVGDYAAYLKPKSSGTLSYLYVQKGPYVLAIHGAAAGGTPLTSQDYQKLATLLLPRLP